MAQLYNKNPMYSYYADGNGWVAYYNGNELDSFSRIKDEKHKCGHKQSKEFTKIHTALAVEVIENHIAMREQSHDKV
jgi:hypothetical protein